MARRLPVDEVRPTQLSLSSEKLAAVVDWFDFDAPTYEPLPAFEYDGEWYLSDGHTRAFVAWLAGESQIRVERDTEVREAYDFDVYRTCIEWCADADVESIPDLRGRVVDPATYEEEWVGRCRAVGTESG
jgi:hypothetical protein